MALPDVLIERLRAGEARYEELNAQLADPQVVSDSKKYQRLAKTHSELGELVGKFREYTDLERGIKEVLAGMGLHLGMDVPNWPPENIEELAKKFEDQM